MVLYLWLRARLLLAIVVGVLLLLLLGCLALKCYVTCQRHLFTAHNATYAQPFEAGSHRDSRLGA